MKRICSQCGAEMKEDAKFCGKCGAEFKVKTEYTSRNGSNDNERNHEKDKINNDNASVENRKTGGILRTVIEIIIGVIVVTTIYNNFFNQKDSPEAAVALQVAKNDMGAGFSQSDIEFDVVAAKDDSKFIVRCKAVSDEAQEMYELVYDRDICFYGVEFGNASGQYFTTIGESERDVKDKMDW